MGDVRSSESLTLDIIYTDHLSSSTLIKLIRNLLAQLDKKSETYSSHYPVKNKSVCF
jgi:hypothetical protein